MVRHERDGLDARFDDVGVELEALRERSGAGYGQEEVADVSVAELEGAVTVEEIVRGPWRRGQ